MKVVVLFLLIAVVSGAPQLDKQEEEQKHLNPINDAAAQEEAINLQKKRTLLGPTIIGQTKHVGIHPLGFKYTIGYGPIGHYPFAKAVTVLKPVLHTSGWKPIIPVDNVPVFKPIVPAAPVKPHVHVVPVQPAEIPKPIVPVTHLVKPLLQVQPQVPLNYPFFKPLFNTVPQVLPHVIQPQASVVVPQLPWSPQPVFPQPQLPPALYHIIKQFPQLPSLNFLPSPELPLPAPAPVPLPLPANPPIIPVHPHAHVHDHLNPHVHVHDHLNPHVHDVHPHVHVHDHLNPHVHVHDVQPHVHVHDHLNPHVDTHVHVHDQPHVHSHPEIFTEHGHVGTSFVNPPTNIPTHPAPQIPLYLPPHPVFRPHNSDPNQGSSSVQTEYSATFPKHPFVSFQHPSISLEPPYLGVNKH